MLKLFAFRQGVVSWKSATFHLTCYCYWKTCCPMGEALPFQPFWLQTHWGWGLNSLQVRFVCCPSLVHSSSFLLLLLLLCLLCLLLFLLFCFLFPSLLFQKMWRIQSQAELKRLEAPSRQAPPSWTDGASGGWNDRCFMLYPESGWVETMHNHVHQIQTISKPWWLCEFSI